MAEMIAETKDKEIVSLFRQLSSFRQKKARDYLELLAVKEKIYAIKENRPTAFGLTTKEAEIAAKAGLITKEQKWWWTEEWQAGERDADRALKEGKTKEFENVDDLIKDLDS